MVAGTDLQWQASLFAGVEEPAVDATFATAERVQFDAGSWIDVVPGWLRGADEVFETLLAVGRWEGHERRMYDRVVAEPRLRAGWLERRVLGALPVLEQARVALGARYDREFDSGGMNLYRDGRDSVAWHRDRIAKEIADPVVGILSLGSTRRFLVRPLGGGQSVRFDPGPGDLLVTGGQLQRRWEHTVPKVVAAAPRISVTFRHGA